MTGSPSTGPATDHDPDLETLRVDLTAALSADGGAWTVEGVTAMGGGRSALTAIAELSKGSHRRRVAVRAQVPGGEGLSIGSLEDQYLLLQRLKTAEVPAPEPILLAEGRSDSTYDVLVTSFVDGDVPHPWRREGRQVVAGLSGDPGFRGAFVSTLAGIHAIAPNELPPNLAHDGAAAARSHAERSRGRSRLWISGSRLFSDDPVLTYTDLWLRVHQVPETFTAGLIHGDYRMGNLVVGSGSINAVLDWELAEAGEGLSDVAWLCGPQGCIDGRPAGLFVHDEDIVAAYEQVTGKRVPADLFNYLKVEGTLRTSAVWAQLSASERARGNEAMARRCQDSVINLVGQCAEVLGLPRHRTTGSDSSEHLLRGLAATSAEIVRNIQGEPTRKPQAPAVRSAQLYLRRVAHLGTAGAFTDYERACDRLIGATGFTDDQHRPSAAQRLCAALTWMSAKDPAMLLTAEVRELIGWSAEPGITFANQMVAAGIEFGALDRIL